jgi:hypothetical protein
LLKRICILEKNYDTYQIWQLLVQLWNTDALQQRKGPNFVISDLWPMWKQ